MINIKSIAVKEKACEFEIPGYEGFKVQLSYLAKDKLRELVEKSTERKYTKGQGMREQLDPQKFQSIYASHVVKGWDGLKFEYLERLMLVEADGVDKSELVPFSVENAEELLKNSTEFDQFVSDCLSDLANFTKAA